MDVGLVEYERDEHGRWRITASPRISDLEASPGPLLVAALEEVARLRARVAGQAGQIGNARDAAGAGLGIPFYAYGDSEAACRLADALNSCASILDGGSS
jgi:hypothetical protein